MISLFAEQTLHRIQHAGGIVKVQLCLYTFHHGVDLLVRQVNAQLAFQHLGRIGKKFLDQSIVVVECVQYLLDNLLKIHTGQLLYDE